MFGEDSEFAPIRMASPLTVKGSGGLSRDELVSKGSGIPVMGGVAGGKKAVMSGIPVMGGVPGIKKSGSSGKLIVERNVGKKIVGRAAGNPTIGTGGELFEKRPAPRLKNMWVVHLAIPQGALRVELFEKRLM